MKVKKSLPIPFQTKHSNFFNYVIPIIEHSWKPFLLVPKARRFRI